MATLSTRASGGEPPADESRRSRPESCPACQHCKIGEDEGCGLRTFSASQIGAVAALVCACLLFLWKLAGEMSASVLTLPGASAAEREMYFSFQFWAILLITALYYAVGEWVAEEQDYH